MAESGAPTGFGRSDFRNSNKPSREIPTGRLKLMVSSMGGGRRRAGSHGASALVRVLIQTCRPELPERTKTKVRLSPEICGVESSIVLLLMVGPRFTGALKGSASVGRVATQRSKWPKPPGRELAK